MMVSKGFLDFLEEHERKLDDFIREPDEEEVLEKEIEKSVIPKLVEKKGVSRSIKNVKSVVKESSNIPFTFCTSCGQKLPTNIIGNFCPFCGKATLMRTDQKTKSVLKLNNISENVSYASDLLSDEPMEQSRLLEHLEKNPVKNPMMEILKQNRGIQSVAVISETADRASDLLDGAPTMGQVQLLEMPDFSKFMPPKPKQETVKKAEIVIDESKLPKLIQQPITNLDLETQRQMQTLGLL